MTLPQAIQILKDHNKWRRGDNTIPMTNAIHLGDAIDTVIYYYTTNQN